MCCEALGAQECALGALEASLSDEAQPIDRLSVGVIYGTSCYDSKQSAGTMRGLARVIRLRVAR